MDLIVAKKKERKIIKLWINSVVIYHIPLESKIAQKMKFFIKDFFSKCDQETADFVIYTDVYPHFLCSGIGFCVIILYMIYWLATYHRTLLI